MNFLLYTTTYGRSGSIQLNRPGFWVPAVLVVSALIVASVMLGYYLGRAVGRTEPLREELREAREQNKQPQDSQPSGVKQSE